MRFLRIVALKAATIVTPTKTSLENNYYFTSCVLLRHYLTRSTSTETANYPGTKLVGVVFKLRKRMKNSPWCVCILHKTLNLLISRCCVVEDGNEMYQNLKCTCRAIVFAHCFVALSLLKFPFGDFRKPRRQRQRKRRLIES